MTTLTQPKPRSPRIKEGLTLPPEVLSKVDNYLSTSVPDKHKLATERALKAQVSKSVAIRIKCLQCCSYARDDISKCTVVTCALHPVRPYQIKL